MKRQLTLLISAAVTLLSTGCYTQFALVDRTPQAPPAEQVEWVVDSATGDTVKVVKQTDTIKVENNQTCVWERDLMGYPHLRCYDSFYARDWFLYNNSPWWYRNDPYWYDYNRCPRYYYYDPGCGCCRYTGTSYYYNNNTRHNRNYRDHSTSAPKKEHTVPGGSTIYPRVRGIPDPRGSKPVPSSSSGSTTTSKSASADTSRQSGQIVIDRENEKRSHVINRRTVAVPAPQNAKPAPAPKPATTSSSGKTASTPPPSQPSTGSTTQSSGDSSSHNQPATQDNNRRHRRNPRSW